MPDSVALEPKPKRTQISVYLDEDDLRRIDAIRAAKSTSRNAVVRHALQKGLKIVEREVHQKDPPTEP